MPVPTENQWCLPEELQELARDGADEVVREILTAFQSDTGSRLLRLRHALETLDRAAIRQQAHTIRGSAVQVGADAVAADCRLLETAAAHQPATDIAALLMRVESSFDEVCRAMDRTGATQ